MTNSWPVPQMNAEPCRGTGLRDTSSASTLCPCRRLMQASATDSPALAAAVVKVSSRMEAAHTIPKRCAVVGVQRPLVALQAENQRPSPKTSEHAPSLCGTPCQRMIALLTPGVILQKADLVGGGVGDASIRESLNGGARKAT